MKIMVARILIVMQMKVVVMVMMLGLKLNMGMVAFACRFCDDGDCMNCCGSFFEKEANGRAVRGKMVVAGVF